MAHNVDARANNPANVLRGLIDDVERLVVAPSGETVELLLTKLDMAEQMFAELLADKVDLRSEEVRWNNILNRLDSRPGLIANAAGQAGGLQKLRAMHPPAESFWWHADEEQTRRQRRWIQRTSATVAVIVVVVGVLYWLASTFFPPDPKAVFVLDAVQQLERHIDTQDWPAAASVIDTALATYPDDPELLIWATVIAEQLGDTERAQRLLAQAQSELTDQPELLWLQLGQYRLRVGDGPGVRAAAEQVLAINPQSGKAYLLMGNSASQAGDNRAALDYFDKAFQLSQKDDPETAVIARMLYGQLLQMPSDIFPSPTP